MEETNITELLRREDARRYNDNDLREERRKLQARINEIDVVLFERKYNAGSYPAGIYSTNGRTKKRGW